MDLTLLANIGNSDLQIEDETLLPVELQKQFGQVRARSEEFSANFKQYREHLNLPLIVPALRKILELHESPFEQVNVVLFASNQPEYEKPEERAKDTYPTAEVVQKLLSDTGYLQSQLGKGNTLQIPKKRIRIETIEGNPADYTNMLEFYMDKLPSIAQRVPDDQAVYVEISGGTPAMTAMLLASSVEVFGERTHTLYVDRGSTTADELPVSSQLFARHTRRTLQTQVQIHAYAVAYKTAKEHGSLISSDERTRNCLQSLIAYGDRRLAFDFENACAQLQTARQSSTGERQSRIKHWYGELSNASIDLLLAELIHSIQIKHQLGDHADMVQRVFRFQEASFRYMAEQMGLEYSKKNSNERAASGWVSSQDGLEAFLESYPIPNTDRTIAVKLDMSLNRISLGAIVDFFMQASTEWQKWQQAVISLHQLSNVADLRNKGLAGHGFRGIGLTDVEDQYGQPASTMIEDLKKIYDATFGQSVGQSPYTALNNMVLAML